MSLFDDPDQPYAKSSKKKKFLSYEDKKAILEKRANAEKPVLKGAKLRGTAFALLGQREYSQNALKEKLLSYGAEETELEALLIELADNNYQSDQRVSEMTVRAELRKGRGPARIKQQLQKIKINHELAEDMMKETDWLTMAITTRQRKFGEALPIDAKEKARQFRFLMYRGFSADICGKALKVNDISE